MIYNASINKNSSPYVNESQHVHGALWHNINREIGSRCPHIQLTMHQSTANISQTYWRTSTAVYATPYAVTLPPLVSSPPASLPCPPPPGDLTHHLDGLQHSYSTESSVLTWNHRRYHQANLVGLLAQISGIASDWSGIGALLLGVACHPSWQVSPQQICRKKCYQNT